MREEIIRLKVTANICDNLYYIRVEKGRVICESSTGTPVCLSTVAGALAKELEFNLECCRSNERAVKVARKFCQFAKKVEIWQPDFVR